MSRAAAQCIRDLQAEVRRLHQENVALRRAQQTDQRRSEAREAKLAAENLRLKQRVRDLSRQVWGKKSERSPGAKKTSDGPTPKPLKKASDEPRRRQPQGPKPFDPGIPRVKIKLPDPALKDLICPVTGERMRLSTGSKSGWRERACDCPG